MPEPGAEQRPPLVVIVGPTGAGKSAVAVALAERVAGEVLSADSQQVYRGMDIGTGKVDVDTRARVRHHLIDVLEPDCEMTAARFVTLADRAIAAAHARGKPVIVAGGTGLYVRVLLFGLFDGPGRDEEFRIQLADEARARGGPEHLWRRLQEIDPDSAARIHERDLRRITRALEVYRLTGTTMSQWQKQNDFKSLKMRYRARLIGLAPPREVLYPRIDARVQDMMAAGLLAEVERLRARGYGPELRSQAAIGYAELHAHLDGAHDLDRAVELIQRNSRRYARRQVSWYRADERVKWALDASEIDYGALQRYLQSQPLTPR